MPTEKPAGRLAPIRRAQEAAPLAPITPELIVAFLDDGTPVVEEVAPHVAAWTGRPVEALRGRPLAETVEPIIPGLGVVVEEVLASGFPVRDYRLSFRDATGTPRTVLVQAGLRLRRAAALQAVVALRLEEVAAPAVTVESPAVRDFYGLVGRSAALRAVIRKIEVYGPTGAPVLITGETGTGKELAARALHACSPRREEPFVAVNCAALSSELLESELFGHERGAFTGAIRTHKGRFERAHRGTLFLDEIGELPVTTQAKLLRVLEEGVIERVGAEQPLPVDVRLIAATNVPLELAVERGTFRADLYHRLAVLRLHMPPLHERLEDLPLLVAYFLKQLQQKYGRPVRGLTPEAIALLQSYSWPGNVRELRNVLERVYVEATGEVIGRRAFEEWVEERWRFFPGAWNVATRRVASSPLVPPPPARAALPALSALSEAAAAEPATRVDRRPLAVRQAPLTRERIAAAFCQTGGNLTAAARRLGVHKATLYRHLKALGMTRTDLEAMAQAGTVPSESGHA